MERSTQHHRRKGSTQYWHKDVCDEDINCKFTHHRDSNIQSRQEEDNISKTKTIERLQTQSSSSPSDPPIEHGTCSTQNEQKCAPGGTNGMNIDINVKSKSSTPVQLENVSEAIKRNSKTSVKIYTNSKLQSLQSLLEINNTAETSEDINRSSRNGSNNVPLLPETKNDVHHHRSNKDHCPLPRDQAVNNLKGNRRSNCKGSSRDVSRPKEPAESNQSDNSINNETGSSMPKQLENVTAKANCQSQGTLDMLPPPKITDFRPKATENTAKKRNKNKNQSSINQPPQQPKSNNKNFVAVPSSTQQNKLQSTNLKDSAVQLRKAANISNQGRRTVRSNCESSSGRNFHPSDAQREQYGRNGSSNCRVALTHNASTNMNRNAPFYQPLAPTQPEWHVDESNALIQHGKMIESIKDQISFIILSEDYSTNYDKHEANIRILREKIIELDTHVFIFDSLKSRACRELATKPTELRNLIFREIYRLNCRLGAFAKRLDMEKYFTSGHRFLIVQGQTGSGKSTQIPQYIADHPRFYGKKIICTQPRKLAAISLARRVAFEYSGGIARKDSFSYIGYQVGGDRREDKGCRIEFVTEGIMLERIMKGDIESFRNVGCIIIDEAHERSITCDLLLGSFKKPDPRWKDLLIITTSATIDLTFFSEFFNNAPTVQIEGRTFPVDVIYQPVTDESELQLAVSKCALQIHTDCKSSPGDILCFLPGLEDITNAKTMFERELRKVTRASGLLEAKVFTLYGKQDPDKQAEVFAQLDSAMKRKIIFATDVAETSITIDGVVYVVDSGVKKEIVFDPERNISSLKINSISKSSAIQRAGRCGRTKPGVCYRLYSQDDFESMNVNAAPEVLCKPISLAVLTLLELSVDPTNFDWISPPSKEAISSAEKELTILGAVDSQRKPTELGKLIAKCQQDPKIMKIVYSGCLMGFGEAACSVASILSVSNQFFWNGNDADTKAKAIQVRKKFAMPEGDIVTMYRIFEEFNNTYNGHGRPIKRDCEDATIIRKPASAWCNDNSLNAKSMFMALTTRTELINQLKKIKVWSKCRSQNKVPTNLEVQQLMCSGYFIQCARVFYSKNVNTPVEYFSTESAVAGRLDFRSSLNLLDIETPPKWIVYDKIVRLPNTIFPIASVMDEDWLKETNFQFYKMCLKKTEDLPTDLIVLSISQVSFRMIVGRNFCNVDSLEKELGCLLTGDADTGKMYLYCAPTKKMSIEQQIQSKIEDALTEIKKQVTEENFIGETRVVIGEGYEVHEILFGNEFATFYIKNVKEDFDRSALKQWLTTNNERLASLDCTYHDKMYTAVAKFSSKNDAKSAYERASKIDAVTVTPSFGVSHGIRHGLTCRLQLTWPTAISKGIAKIFFSTAQGANQFLDNVHYIYPNVKVHVSGETQRNALKMRELRPKVIQPPLTYLKLPRNERGCRFRFDEDAIDQMTNKHQLNYRVTLDGLKLSVDKFELMTSLSVYSPKNVTVEYENFEAPESGNGLTPEEKSIKLKPLRRFMDPDTKTSDFFKRNTGVAGICIFFTSNSIAKESYNYTKAEYDSLQTDPLLGPHRLEIEFTHTISIQMGLYKFLQSQINALQKEARDKGITSILAPIQDNAKSVIVKFHTSKHLLLGWIQEKLDELVRPTKFNCPYSDVLFRCTGRLELGKFAKTNYINWSDESHIIWVYGSAEVKEKSCEKIEKIAKHLHSLDVLDQEIWLNKTVRINGKEGRNITTRCREAAIAFHHFHGNKMYISGSQASVDAVVQYLAQNKYSWDRSKRNRFKYEESRECGLCGMPPDNTFIMLSVCGHLFCSDCIGPMVNMQPPPFPIKCPICFEFVALHDIKKLAPAKSLEKVLELAVRSFQQNHRDDIRECPDPGCQQLLCYQQRTAGPNGGDFLFCDECITTYCISCSEKMEKPVKSHEDDSCENIQNGVANLVYRHVRIIQETVLNLSCPKCKTAFLDFTGCAAVTCDTCKAGFCGLCLAHCGQDAHSHVRTCSKNPTGDFFVSQAVLDAVHLDMRNRKLQEYLQTHRITAQVQQQLVEKIRKDLTDLRMNVPVVSANSYEEVATEVSTDVMRHVRKIQETILTLSCPNCDAAFFDFDGCAAVTCASCQMEFCGLCLDFVSRNVRVHVLSCQRNSMRGNFFLNSDELLKIHAAVRTDKVQSYFDGKITDTETKEKVLAIIGRDLTELQIKLPGIVSRQRVRPAVHVPPHHFPQPQQRDFVRQLHREFYIPPAPQAPQPQLRYYGEPQEREPLRRPAPQVPQPQLRYYGEPQEREPLRRPARQAPPPRPPPRSECCIL